MLFKEQNINIISIAQIFYAVGGKTGEYIRYNTPLCSNELIYRLDGENYTYFNGQKFHICGGTAYFLPRGRHSQYDVDIVEHGDSIDIWFECDRRVSEQAIACDMSSNRRVGELFIKLERLWRSKQDGYYYKCMSELYRLMRELSRPERYLESSKLGAIDGAVRYIDENFSSRDFFLRQALRNLWAQLFVFQEAVHNALRDSAAGVCHRQEDRLRARAAFDRTHEHFRCR